MHTCSVQIIHLFYAKTPATPNVGISRVSRGAFSAQQNPQKKFAAKIWYFSFFGAFFLFKLFIDS